MDTELAKNPLAELPTTRKIVLLILFSLSQFLDTFSISALFSAIPVIATSTGLNNSQSVWLNSAYQLSFAALLLVSGRMSDIYNPKIVFLAGAFLIGFFSLGIGFARNAIVILVLRALSGIGAALSIPSSLHLVVHTFPDPVSQAKAVGAFSGAGALGNIFGIVIGALIISYANWPWVFYVAAILALFIATTCTLLIPHPRRSRDEYSLAEQLRRVDIFGSSILVAALVLLIFAVTSGSTDGWKSVTVLVPLFLGLALFGSFFVWEARVAEDHASIPPRLWSYPNFGSLISLALLPYTWWGVVYLLFSWYWQEVQSWSAINAALHFICIGLSSCLFFALSSVLQRKFEYKHILLGGLFLMVSGSIFLIFGDRASRYWPIVFPGLVIGTAGTTIVFSTANVAVFATMPPEMAGTVGAVFNCALQLGSSVCIAVATSIQTTVQPSPESFVGRSAAFGFLIGVVVVAIVSVLAFLRETGNVGGASSDGDEDVKDIKVDGGEMAVIEEARLGSRVE